MDRFPSAFDGVAFAFVRPDESFVDVYTATSQDRYIGHSGPVVPLSEFFARNAEVVLPRGYVIQGKVMGADEEPLAGVTLSETQGRSLGIVARTVTGPDGRFILPNRPAKEIVPVARAPSRAQPCRPACPQVGFRLAGRADATSPDRDVRRQGNADRFSAGSNREHRRAGPQTRELARRVGQGPRQQVK
ncbi:MAG: carboxypeptidase regulatory-like domain-containing protein [Verrucomicrobia bacterium]|nr:carboxypeptidase regulatory-like domain-containing protein [Verrucomicrobiota bacterium]